jgi:ankyrin repeat protein
MLRRALATLPSTLDGTYERILSTIREADSQYAIPILQWLTFAARPLSLDEVAEIVAIDVKDEPKFDREEVLEDPTDVLSICSSLITVTTDKAARKVVLLAHYSVKEYLVSDRIRKGPAARYGMQDATFHHDSIAKGCIAYLLQFQELEVLDQDTIKTFKLAEYAAKFWVEHARGAKERTEGFSQAAMDLLSENNAPYLNWLRIHNPDVPWVSDFRRTLASVAAPLYYACLSGLGNLVKLLLTKGANVNPKGGYYDSALQVASARGQEQVVRLLIDKGANVNTQGGRSGNALQAASYHGHEQLVDLLLRMGANIDAQGGLYSNALQAALAQGYEQVARLLLDKGADVNAQGGLYGNALQAAIGYGYEQFVGQLLDKGADVNAQGGYYGNALQAASLTGHAQVARLLLERGADVNVKGGYYGNALQAALAGGHEQVVTLLLDKGADINAQGGMYGNALQTAAARGYVQLVQLLLERGANWDGHSIMRI